MRLQAALGLILTAALAPCTGRALCAEPPKSDPAPAAEAQKIPESDRWFVSSVLGAGGKVKMNLHLVIKKSGQADAPLRVTCECTTLQDGKLSSVTVESLCLNDEWLSPVKVDVRFTGEDARSPKSAAFTRPDPKSTAGAMLCDAGLAGQKPIEFQVPEHCLLTTTPIEIVRRMPFEKGPAINFPMFRMLEMRMPDIKDCSLYYTGERAVEFREGHRENLHFFFQSIGNRMDDAWSEYALNAKHEVVYAKIERMTLLLSTEAEARKAVEVEKPAEPEK